MHKCRSALIVGQRYCIMLSEDSQQMLGNGLREGKKTDKRIIITVIVQKKNQKAHYLSSKLRIILIRLVFFRVTNSAA